jgi:hypothetical protein
MSIFTPERPASRGTDRGQSAHNPSQWRSFPGYRARVMSGSGAATSLGRLRALERTATAAADRLAHARRTRRDAGK